MDFKSRLLIRGSLLKMSKDETWALIPHRGLTKLKRKTSSTDFNGVLSVKLTDKSRRTSEPVAGGAHRSTVVDPRKDTEAQNQPH